MLVETRVGRLWVEDRAPSRSGSSPAKVVVLWHSLLCDGGMWSAQIPWLAEDHRVISIDAPGHGRSAPTRRPYTMDDCVEAAIEVLEQLRVERCVWVGLSWGGMVGMRLALRAPRFIAGLVLMDTNADAETREKLPQYRVMAVLARMFGAFPKLLDRVVPIYFSPRSLRERRDIVQRFREGIVAMDRTSLVHALDAVMFTRSDIRPRLFAIHAPTLVIVGEDDIATPLARANDIVRGIRGAELVRIPEAGHLSAWERPELVDPPLRRFLAQLAW